MIQRLANSNCQFLIINHLHNFTYLIKTNIFGLLYQNEKGYNGRRLYMHCYLDELGFIIGGHNIDLQKWQKQIGAL